MQRQLLILHKTYHNCNTCAHAYTHTAADQNNFILQANNRIQVKSVFPHMHLWKAWNLPYTHHLQKLKAFLFMQK